MTRRASLLLFVGIIAVCGVLMYRVLTRDTTPPLSDCIGADRYVDMSCLRNVVRETMAQRSPSEILKEVEATLSTRAYCHTVGHIIGEELYKTSGSLEEALGVCTDDCRHSCLHGVIGSAFRETTSVYDDIVHASRDEIVKAARTYCQLGEEYCHAIGHVLYIALEDYGEALRSCAEVSVFYTREKCFEGVFMQGSGGQYSLFGISTSPEVDASNYSHPCDELQDTYRFACFRYLPAHQEALFHANGIPPGQARVQISIDTCLAQPMPARSDCFYGIGMYLGKLREFGVEKQAMCHSLPDDVDRDSCTIGVIRRFAYNYDFPGALEYCSGIERVLQRKACYDAAFQFTEIHTTRVHATWGPLEACDRTPSASNCKSEYNRYTLIRDELPLYAFGLFGPGKLR